MNSKYFKSRATVMFNSAAGYLIPVFFLLCIFGLLLWDMKKVQSLSKLIHDDHVDHWEYIEDESVHGWHSPLDHCMLNLSESGADVKKYKETECAGLTGFGGTEQHNARLYCSIGSSLGKPCSSPLSTRSFFNSQLKSAHLGDPHSRFLSNVSLAIAKSKRPIIFIGDGITKQNQDAFVCELIRSDDVYVTGSMRGEAGQQTSNFTVYWKNSPYKLDVKFIKVTRVNEHGGGGSGMNLRRKIAAASQFADEKGLTGLNRTKLFEQIMNDSTVRLPARIAPPVPFHQLKSLVDDEIDTYGGVVLVANLGVSYNHRENFRTDITDFLAWLNEIGGDNSNDVFFRETAAQHWNHTENGYYSYDIELRRNGSCVPIADNIPEYDWRNGDVKHSIINNKLEYVHLLPFREITSPLYNMHPYTLDAPDCTHYCYFPQMWQSIWYDMLTHIYLPPGDKLYRRDDTKNRTAHIMNR